MKPEIWNQLKGITSKELIAALLKDGWTERASGGSAVIFKKNNLRVSIRNHPHKAYGPGQLRDLFKDIGWNEQELRRLKLIK
jgi:predicted RNA binding protein YcfA (HicA-like mRNA interferase family)